MPGIIRIECTACGQGPALETPLAGWVTTDGKKGGRILPDSYLALKLETGGFVPLPHPIEGSRLKQHGFTWARAAKEGRLFCVTYKICTACGLIHEERQIQNQRLGCNIGFFGAVVALILFKFIVKVNWGLSLLLSYFAAIGMYGMAELLDKGRWRQANQELKLKCCTCGNIEFITISKAIGKMLPCPFCKTRNMKYTAAGKS
jgi:hypothetical protein